MPSNLFAVLDSGDEEDQVVFDKGSANDASKQVKLRNNTVKKSIKGKENKKANGRHQGKDRKSGTGHGREGVKHGSGAHNWGSMVDEVELSKEAEVQKGDVEETQEEEEEEEEEEEIETFTLEEYQAMVKAERSGELFEETEVRVVKNEFRKDALVNKDDKTEDFMEAKTEKVYRERSSGRKKKVITDVGFRNPPTYTNDRRSNNTRGRGRGRGRGRSYGPNVTDMRSFPTLG